MSVQVEKKYLPGYVERAEVDESPDVDMSNVHNLEEKKVSIDDLGDDQPMIQEDELKD